MLIVSRDGSQKSRMRIGNQLGLKKDGTPQDIKDERAFDLEDYERLVEIRNDAMKQEEAITKDLKRVLKRNLLYTDFLANVKGCAEVSSAYICGMFDFHKATTVSKLWQYAGLNSAEVRGKKRKDLGNGKFEIVTTDTKIRGDKLTPGFVSPFNKELRTALLGVMASGFIMQKNSYAMEYYYPYKERLAHSDDEVLEYPGKGKPPVMVKWKDAKPAHRDRAAQRYMLKMFLIDVYVAGREALGLPVRNLYMEEYLGKKHAA